MYVLRWQGRLPLLHRMGSLENLFPAPRFWIDPDPDPWLLLLLRDAHVLPFSPFFSAGLKVNRLDMYGEKYKPFKGIKYMTKAGKFQVRTWRACVPWRSNYGHVFISYLSQSKTSACFLGQFPPGSICSLCLQSSVPCNWSREKGSSGNARPNPAQHWLSSREACAGEPCYVLLYVTTFPWLPRGGGRG